jgi:ferrous iron transport protein B
MIFNLLCAPCFAAMGAIKQEMNNAKWTWAAIGWMTAFAYAASLIVYNIGMLFVGVFTIWTAVAFVVLALLIYFLFRRNKYDENQLTVKIGR